MAKVTIRVDRDITKYPKWTQNFFEHAVFNLLLKPINPKYDLLVYGLIIQELGGGKRKDKNTPTQEMIDEVISSLPLFDPPVTLAYTNKSHWTFTWDTPEEQTYFLLKWS